MLSFKDKIPGFLRGKQESIATVGFAALFATVVLIFTVPFSETTWFRLGMNWETLFIAIFYFGALAIMSISRRILYATRNTMNVTFFWYIVWCVMEIVLIADLYLAVSLAGHSMCGIDLCGMTAADLFIKAFIKGMFTIGLADIIIGQYLAINEKDQTMRLMNFGSVVTDAQPAPKDEKKVTLYDNAGVLKLVLSMSSLYYIESDDNYIKVWYEDAQGSMRQYMLRCKLKTVEDSFQDSDLLRCHRKYIVNISKVAILTKEKDGYMLDLGLESVAPIPVSKSYEESLLSRFNSR